jgi:SNF2 family DNA or RNA helicase
VGVWFQLYSQINALQPKLFTSWYKFAQHYCDGHRNKFGHFQCIGASNLEELNQTLTEHIMIRRLKSEVMQELPSKICQKITFDIQEKELKEIQQSFDQLKRIFSVLDGSAEVEATDYHATRFHVNSLLTKMFLQTGEAKIPGVLTYLNDFLEIMKHDVKFLVFAHHLVVQRAIAEMLVKANVGFVHIYSEVPAAKRQEYVKQFQEQPKTRVALLSLKAANTVRQTYTKPCTLTLIL